MTVEEKKENYKWNFTVNLIDGASFWFGSSFISASTILPLFISKLTSSLLPIGLISVITAAGWFIPQLFSARITESKPRMKKIVVGWGLFLERIPIWIMILSGFLAKGHPILALSLFLFCLTWHTIGAGIIAPAWMALMAKLFSAEKRGSFLGTTMFIGSGMGIFGAIVSAWLLRTLAFPTSFIFHFIISAVFILISWFFLGLNREPISADEIITQDRVTYRKELLKIFKMDHNFRRFILSAMIITFGAMGTGFFTISAIRRFDITDATVGLYTFTMLAGQTVGNLVLGWMADKYGHKLSLEIGVAANFIAFFLAVMMPQPEYFFVVFVLFGIYLSSGISGMLVVWEFCPISRVPTYSGLANTARGLVGLLAPLLASQIAEVDYRLLFGLCAIVTLLGLFLLNRWVIEPRWHSRLHDQGEISGQ
jgi:MFS family permease